MVLSRRDIQKAIDRRKIVFDPPIEESQLGEASVDLRLATTFTKLKRIAGMKVSVARGLAPLVQAGFWVTEDCELDAFGNQRTYTLEPGDFVLGMTHERVTVPPALIGLVEGRSTYARVGLSMHQTAPWIQPGWSNTRIVLEMANMGPLAIELTPLLDRPCQLTFLKLSSALPAPLRYGAKPGDDYAGQEHPIDVRRPRRRE